MPLLVLLFVVVPIVELVVIIKVGQAMGIANTIAALLVISLVGAALVKHQGLGVIRRINDQASQGRVPGKELVDGFLVLMAGALLLTPGFVTDAIGLLTLLPPVRAGMRKVAGRRMKSISRVTRVIR